MDPPGAPGDRPLSVARPHSHPPAPGPAGASFGRIAAVAALCGAVAFGITIPVQRLADPGPAGATAAAEAERNRRDVDRWTARADTVLRAAESVARQALETPFFAPKPIDGEIGDRLEGYEIYEGDDLLEWQGSPAPAFSGNGDGRTDWRIVVRGARVRLLVGVGPDGTGRRAIATFLLADGTARARFGTLVDVPGLDVGDPLPIAASAGEPTGASIVTVRAPDGTALMRCPVARRASPWSRTGSPGLPAAVAATVACLAMGAGFVRRRRLTEAAATWTSSLARIGAIAVGRAILTLASAPAVLLPAPLGTATIFGRSGYGGLLSSPIDLALTGVALWLVAREIASVSASRRTKATVAIASLPAAVVAAWIAIETIAIDGRVRPFDPAPEGPALASAAIAIGVVATLIACAELLAAFWRHGPGPREYATRSRVGATVTFVVLLAVGAAWALHRHYDTHAAERLATEFAPQVQDQNARRRLALQASVDVAAERVARRLRETADVLEPGTADDLMYRVWVESPLFHAGYRSSMTLYDDHGDPVGHFGFDIPDLDERPTTNAETDAAPVTAEPLRVVDALPEQRLLHAERAIRGPEGRFLGTLVGHVLDEPDNLPFLPSSRVWLAALESGGLGGEPVRTHGDAPEYVRYDPFGVARSQTLNRPPSWSYAFDKAAIEGGRLRVDVGNEPYAAVPILETRHLHLLLAPASSVLDRLGTAVRIAIVGFLLLAVVELLPRLLRRGGAAALVGTLASSYYRKLAAAVLAASVLPWIGLALFLRSDAETRGETIRIDAATQLAIVARRVLEDFAESQPPDTPFVPPDDNTLYWLRRLVGQDLHLYERGSLIATSKGELVTAGLLQTRLPSEVDYRVSQANAPVFVRKERFGPTELPVAYAPLTVARDGHRLVLAVPMILHQPEIARALRRNAEIILLSTVLLSAVLAALAAPLARTVGRPIRDLVSAARRIASGDFGTRLVPRSRDEIAELVESFNIMVEALERQRADLVRRRDYMEALLQNATTGVVSTDSAGRVVTINPAAVALLRSSQGPPRLAHPLSEELRRDDARTALADRLADPAGDASFEIDLADDDTPRRLRVVRVPLPDPAGGQAGALVLLEDVTDLMRRNQLEAWAEMARAIAHEIKNPLTPVMLSTEHLERILRDRGTLPSPEIESCIETVKKQVRSLREIATEFSTYAKVPALSLEPSDPAAFLGAALDPYRAALPEGVELRETFAPCPAVALDSKILGRAIVNLVENALHAMPAGGVLDVSCGPTEAGDEVEMIVRDTGTGLSREARARLFEPYFSTKSSGTGLGLAIVRRTIEGHRGTIEVAGNDGPGTTFRITLPASGPRDSPTTTPSC